MKKLVFGLAAGLLIGCAGTAIASQTGAVEAVFAKFNLKVDNKEIVQIEPLIYDGTSYLPVREVGELLGYQVDYEDANRLIILETPNPAKNEASEAGKKVNIADINMDEWSSHLDLADFYGHWGPGHLYLQGTPDGKTKLMLDGNDIIFPVHFVESRKVKEPTIYTDITGKHSMLVYNDVNYFPVDIGKSFGMPAPNEWITQDEIETMFPSMYFHQTWTQALSNADKYVAVEVGFNIGKIRVMKSDIGYFFNKEDADKLISRQ